MSVSNPYGKSTPPCRAVAKRSPEQVLAQREAERAAAKRTADEADEVRRRVHQQQLVATFPALLAEAQATVDAAIASTCTLLEQHDWRGGQTVDIVDEYVARSRRHRLVLRRHYTEQHTVQRASWVVYTLFHPRYHVLYLVPTEDALYVHSPSKHLNEDGKRLGGYHNINLPDVGFWPTVDEEGVEAKLKTLTVNIVSSLDTFRKEYAKDSR